MSDQQPVVPKKKAKVNYVNNKDLYAALSAYLDRCTEIEQAYIAENYPEQPTKEQINALLPSVPKYIGESIYEIANRIARKGNFINYPYRDDMIMDGVENCLRYIRNFNPEKTNNPFAYFTTIISFAFIRRIQKEKKQMYIRYKSSHALVGDHGTYDSEEVQLHLNTSADYIDEFVRTYEEGITSKRAKTKNKNNPVDEN